MTTTTKVSQQTFPTLLQKFFMQRLLQQRHASPQTIAAYRDSFRLLFRFAQRRLVKQPCELVLNLNSAVNPTKLPNSA